MGPFRDSDAQFYTLKKLFWSPGPVKILGIYMHTKEEIRQFENFEKMLPKVDEIIEAWKYRSLTLLGKITVINSLINTLFIHKFLALASPKESFFEEFKRKIVAFLWDNKRSKVAYHKLIQSYEKLGLKLVDLKTKELALKAAWPARWNERNSEELAWFYNSLPIKDKRIWYCNTSVRDIKVFEKLYEGSPSFSIWKAWATFHFSEISEYEEILNANLWGNSEIRRRNRPIFDARLTTSNIDKILDIYDPIAHQFYKLETIMDNYGNVFDMLFYLSIRAAIPNKWKITLRNNTLESELDMETDLEIVARSKSASKYIYWCLIEAKYIPSDGNRIMWQSELGTCITEDEWYDLFPNFVKLIKPAKLRYFQYRVLTKTLTTNYIRSKWNKDVTNKCTFCKDKPETILHLLWECKVVYPIWSKVERICNYFFNIKLVMSKEMCILNNYVGKNKKIVNTIIATMKQWLYAQKCFEIKPDFAKFMEKLSYWYEIDLCHAIETGTRHKCIERWKNMF